MQVIKASEKPTVEFSELVVQSSGEAVKYDTICVEGKEKAVHEFIRDKVLRSPCYAHHFWGKG